MTADQAANPLRDLRAGMRQGMSAVSGAAELRVCRR